MHILYRNTRMKSKQNPPDKFGNSDKKKCPPRFEGDGESGLFKGQAQVAGGADFLHQGVEHGAGAACSGREENAFGAGQGG